MDFIGLIFHLIYGGVLEEMRGKGGEWAKGVGGIEHIDGSRVLDGLWGLLGTILGQKYTSNMY